jgi:iron(III) transport system substrate-binding protein
MRRFPTLVLLVPILSACGGGGGEPADSLTVYSGRNERLIGPLLERYAERSGVAVRQRYGSTSELTATILEEGDRSPADLFVSQDAAALGALARAGLLRELPADLLDRVPQRFRSPDDVWIGLSGRARSVVYNPERIDAASLPQSLEEIGDPRFRGSFGVAPTNASFQAHMALYATVRGERALGELLDSIVANEPLRYPKNTPIVEAVIAGEIDWGLVNHYYLWRALSERPDAPARNFFMSAGDASGFVNMAGAGALNDRPETLDLLRFLLSDEAQRYFADETYEYPLVPGVEPAVDLPPLDTLLTPDVDYASVADSLEPTLLLIDQSGLTRF